MKWISCISLVFLVFSCSNDAEKPGIFDKKETSSNDNLSFEERVKREVEAKLNIPATEKYNIEIKRAHLNGDEKEDAIITVNQIELAQKEASKENGKQRLEFGLMGNFNHFFYYDGSLDKISVPVTISSSAKTPLHISFENIQSEIYQDLIVEYRIRNAAFRNYYIIDRNSMILVFQWKLYDKVGLDDYEANYLEYQDGTLSLAKDILIYKGKIKNYNKNINDIYTYKPEIEKNGDLQYRFFYDPRTMKYMTKKNNL